MPYGLPTYFEERIRQDGECWLWTGPFRNGYGTAFRMKDGRRSLPYAHREVYRLLVGDPGEMDCHHTCPNKTCVNPAHIELLTRSEHLKGHCYRRWQDMPPEELVARDERRRQRNRGYLKRWRERNPEAYRAIWRRYEAKRRANKGTAFEPSNPTPTTDRGRSSET